jgi:hypothetical protein
VEDHDGRSFASMEFWLMKVHILSRAMPSASAMIRWKCSVGCQLGERRFAVDSWTNCGLSTRKQPRMDSQISREGLRGLRTSANRAPKF